MNESTGIFRMNPPVGKLNQLQQQIDSSNHLYLPFFYSYFSILIAGQVEFQPDTDLDIVATLLKRFFRDLQPAILPSPKEFKEFKSRIIHFFIFHIILFLKKIK